MSPYTLLGGTVAVVALAVGSFFYGHHEGADAVQVKFNQYKTDQSTLANKQLSDNQAALAKQQKSFDDQIAAIQKDHANEVTDIEKRRDSALASSDYYAGQLRHFLNAKPGPTVAGVSAPAASANGANGSSAGGLPDGVSNLNWYLITRFSAADVIASRLNEAVAVIAKDREICNGTLPGVTP